MKHLLGKIAVALAAVLVGLFVANAAPAQMQQRPYKFKSMGQFMNIPDQPCARFMDSGQGTHVGDFRATAIACIVGVDDPDNPINYLWSGNGVLTAANGNVLYFTVSGTTNIETGVPGEGLLKIQGGTGRFIGALGEITFLQVYVGPQIYINSGSGWVSY